MRESARTQPAGGQVSSLSQANPSRLQIASWLSVFDLCKHGRHANGRDLLTHTLTLTGVEHLETRTTAERQLSELLPTGLGLASSTTSPLIHKS